MESAPTEQELITRYLGTEGVLQDPRHNDTIGLKETQSTKRRELVSDVEYTFSLAFNKGANYLGQATIDFQLVAMPQNDTDLFLNSLALAISDLRINEHKVSDSAAYQGQAIALRPAHLKLGWNKVTLKYFTPYQTNRVGLHTYLDQKDGLQYLYTQFEAFHCFKVFPCFD